MKKTAIVLASALILALAAPMGFAASIDISGQMESRFEYKQDQDTKEWGFGGKTGFELTPTLRVGDNVEMGMQLKTHDDELDKDGNPDRPFEDGHKPLSVDVSRLWLTTTGPFWQGGPSVTTTIGDKDIKWNEWVAHLGNSRTIAVEGIDLMVADADVFYAWDEVGEDEELELVNPMGLRLNSEFAGVEMNGMLLRQGNAINAAFGAATELDGVHVDGVAAMDADYRYAFKVNASMNPAEDVTLSAGYRQMQDGFSPLHARTNDDGNIVPFHEDSHAAGFNIGVETVQHGFTLGAMYDQPTEKATVSAARTFDVYNHALDAKYEASFVPGNNMEHELEASTTTDLVPYVPGIGLDGKVKLAGEAISYEVNSTYTAPNGISLGAGYHSEDGPVVSGGLKLEF